MKREINRVLKEIQRLSEEPEFIKTHKRNAEDFTRQVKLGFADIITFVIGRSGNTFDLEKLKFCKKIGEDVSVSALCQARDKIKYTAYEELLQKTSKVNKPVNFFNGYRITSIDGIQGELPRTAELMSKYRPSSKAQYPMFHAIAEYDVLNCCYSNAIFGPAPADERELACQLLEKHDYEEKEIFLLDRGLASIKMIQKLEQSKKKYIMRIPRNFLRETSEFEKLKSEDKMIHVFYDKRRKATNGASFAGEEYEFDIRGVKIALPKGKEELLITNLTKEEMKRSEVGNLYNLRWRIETSFLDLKYAVHIEDFLGKKEEFIKQEFFASLIQANLMMMYMEVSNMVIANKKKRIKNLSTW